MNAFLTGSRVYGNPRVDSDIDLVVLCTPKTKNLVYELVHSNEMSYKPYEKGACFQFGRLNIIMCEDVRTFCVWKKGTEELIKKAPVTREYARKYFLDLETYFVLEPDHKALVMSDFLEDRGCPEKWLELLRTFVGESDA